MTSRKSLSKRKYPAYTTTEEGKWFTGFEGDVTTTETTRFHTLCEESYNHLTKLLKLTPSHTVRGRSAANLVFKDHEGFPYLLSMKSVDNFLKGLSNGDIIIQEGYFEAEFCQVKQGQNYFIDLVED